MVYAPDVVPDDEGASLIRRIERLERMVEQLGGADVLRTAGIRTEPGKFIIDGDLEVTKRITNEWLENPISMDGVAQGDTAMAPSATAVAYATWNCPVPAGYTKAVVFATGSARFLDTSASTQYFFAQTRLLMTNGAWRNGGTQQIALASGFQGTMVASLAAVVDVPDEPAQVLTLWVDAWASAAMAAHSGNYVGIDAVVLFTR